MGIATRSTSDATTYCVVITTCSSGEQAESICATLLNERLAACIQVVDVRSSFMWKGKQETENEKLLLIKTRSDLYPKLEVALHNIHPYETPEIISLPVKGGLTAYLDWIDEVTKSDNEDMSGTG